ncbi:hypothetical protein TNCV_5034681 [Trichonephila clavipes]|nr:hypothetical protein TNCV_5034681 [Trichonephila clavipes]
MSESPPPSQAVTDDARKSDLFRRATADIVKICDSLLIEQNLYAVQSIILPRLDFTCRNAHVMKHQVENWMSLFLPRRNSNLPSHANTLIVHLAYQKGVAALSRFQNFLDIHENGHAFRMLSSPDGLVSGVPEAGLRSVTVKKIRLESSLHLIAEFLNGFCSSGLSPGPPGTFRWSGPGRFMPYRDYVVKSASSGPLRRPPRGLS